MCKFTEAKVMLKNLPDIDAIENNFLVKESFDAGGKLILGNDKIYLEIALDKAWLKEQKRKLVTTTI